MYTRLQSKSNRCIWHTTLIIWLLTRPGSSNSTDFSSWSVQLYSIFLLCRTATTGAPYSLWGSPYKTCLYGHHQSSEVEANGFRTAWTVLCLYTAVLVFQYNTMSDNARNTSLKLILMSTADSGKSAVVIRYWDSLCRIYSDRISGLIRCHALRF
jgi:hypothetical protein